MKVIKFEGMGTLRIGVSSPAEFAAMHNHISIDLDPPISDDKAAEKLSLMLSTLGLNEPGLIYRQESLSLKDMLGEVQESLTAIDYLTSELDKRDKQQNIFQKISSLFSEENLKAEMRAKIPFKVTPHGLRASAVTYLKQQGFSDSDIQKVTGHALSQMANA